VDQRGACGTNSDLTDVALLAAFTAAVALVAAAATGLSFAHAPEFFSHAAGLLGKLAVLDLYLLFRMPEKKQLIFTINMLMLMFCVSNILLTYQYALALLPAAPISQWIHDADAAMRFHWIDFSQKIHSVPNFSEILGFCYRYWIRETVLVVIVLAFCKQFSRVREFAVGYILTGMATISVTGFLDAQSYDCLAALSTAGAHIPTGFARELLDKAVNLRSGLDHTVDLTRPLGLVCFPSLHAGAALLMATATRGVKWLWLPFLVFNILIIIGTITEGGHNFADVIGGCAVTIAAIAGARAYLQWGGAGRWLQVGVRRSAAALASARNGTRPAFD
jgi:membrane-associated phospholipid phosphatase